MQLKEVKSLEDIKQGDNLIISSEKFKNRPVKAQLVKIDNMFGMEVIFDKRKNHFFNLEMYLKNESWIKEVKVVTD